MYQVILTLDFKRPVDDDAIQKVWMLVADCSQSGQLFGDAWVTRPSSNRAVQITGACHEQTAFSPRYYSKRGRKSLTALKPLLRKKIGIRCERFVEDDAICTCKKVGRILFSPDVVAGASPFRCLQCRGRRPAYRLSGVDFRAFGNLARQWIGFYWIWMDSGRTEALAWRQLADPDSDFSGMSRQELKDLEKELRIPVYYDLLSHYVSQPEGSLEATLCPGCGGKWAREPDAGLTCSPCRLFSYSPQDQQPPDWWKPLNHHRRRVTRP